MPTALRIARLSARTAPTHTAPLTLSQLAWAAGIWEGEGSIVYSAESLRVEVAQKDRWILDRLRAWFGGNVYVRREHYRNGAYVLHKWYLHGARARGFAYTIYSWLSPRRRLQVRTTLGMPAREAVA